MESIEALLQRDAGGDDARDRELADALAAGTPLVLFGAGTVGRQVLALAREAGVEPACFGDDTPGKHGTTLDGLRVLSIEDAVAAYPGAIVAVTLLNPALPYLPARARLASVLDPARVRSAFELGRALGAGRALPSGFVEPAAALLARGDAVRHVARLLAHDPESMRQLAAHLRFRIDLEFGALPAPSDSQYLPDEVLTWLRPEATFVDGGAFDGDTLRALFAARPDHVGAVLAFEPDPGSFARLAQWVAQLPPVRRAQVDARQLALGARPGRVRFAATGTPAAAAADDGNAQVEVTTLDAALDQLDADTSAYVKLDVEGAELDALRGATTTLRRLRPALAVCVYHRPDDLWTIPRWIEQLELGYRLLLRTHGHDGQDLVLYALPPA